MSKKQKAKADPFAITLTPKEGASLLRDAVGWFRDEQRRKSVMQVKTLLERMETLKRIAAKTEKQMQLTEQQLEAIHLGKFRLKPLTSEIVYLDDELNVSWDATAQW